MKSFMQLTLCVLAALCLSLKLAAQTVQMRVEGPDASKVSLEDLKVDVKVTGGIAATTWTMVFRNSSARLLEGELTFPLAEGTTVSRYAIDINGKLRDAVPVDKARGTTVLEAIEQRRVDPGLLERVEGNAFRTRIYPLPAGGTRTVVIGYEEVLHASGNKLEYRLPLSFQKEVQKVTISVSSFGPGKPENSRGSAADMAFDRQGSTWQATKELTRFASGRPLVFHIPQAKEPEVLMQGKGDRYYCLINTPPRSGNRERVLPKELTILWDASLSGLRRNHEAELALLGGYLRRAANATVNLIVFSNTAQPMRSFTIRSGDWHLLREALEGVVYDGGTQPGVLNLAKLPGREFLLFSDGLATYGRGNPTTGPAPVYCINAAATADYASLRVISARTGGQLIDLAGLSAHAALEQLINQPLMLLGVSSDEDIDEVFPNVPVSAERGASIAAIAHIKSGEITLKYGYGRTVTEERKVSFNAETGAAKDVDLGRILAAQKIAALNVRYDANKVAIESLAKRFGLVTRNTSLIVLEALADYVSYGIEPPAELRADYDRMLKERGQQSAAAAQARLKTAEATANALAGWWNQKQESTPDISKPEAVPQPAPPPARAKSKGLEVHATRGYTAPIINPENPGGRQVKTAEQIEKAPTRNTADIAALSTQVYQGGKGGGLNIGGGRESGTKYIIDGVQLPPGSANFFNAAPSAGFIEEGKPLFGIGEGRRQKRRMEELDSALAKVSKLVSLSDSALLDSLFSFPEDAQYTAYLQLRQARLQNPVFYFQVAGRFIASNRRELGVRILSNLAELELENYELYKMLGYKLREVGDAEAALEAFRKVLAWRPMDPQSRRDYGLALADAGFYRDATDTLYAALTMDIDPSLQSANSGLDEVLLCDMAGILTQHPGTAPAGMPRELLQQLPSDIRVVINWNMKSTDIDLWVTDPAGEKCYYGHNATAAGGRMSRDVTQGFGPEQFLLRNARSGRYKVEVNYYGDRQVKIAGPATVMAEIYTGWGKPSQQRQIIVMQMKPDDRGGVLVGEFGFGGRP